MINVKISTLDSKIILVFTYDGGTLFIRISLAIPFVLDEYNQNMKLTNEMHKRIKVTQHIDRQLVRLMKNHVLTVFFRKCAYQLCKISCNQ